MSAIVAVHGVGNHEAGAAPDVVAAARARTWGAALATGLGRPAAELDVAFAYYAHHLYRGQPVAQGGPDEDAFDRLAPADPALAVFAEQWLAALDLPPATVQGRLTVPLRQIAQVVAERFRLDGRLTHLFMSLFVREVTAYLRDVDAPARIAAREEVAACIAAHRPRVVIAHSLGSVVTYEALHAHPESEVELLVTLGSPLALPHAVFHRLRPTPTPTGTRPPGVRRWVNVADHGDPVAIPRPFSAHFPDVDLDLAESVGLFAFHPAVKYLGSAAVAATVAPYLAASSQG
ncbi:hypothetical protein [Embleya sp. NPDC005971]|uniref:hypothetical protein n=1 Tax=unclassified Embleya TaxID=2699296 RepID=UPI0033E1119D